MTPNEVKALDFIRHRVTMAGFSPSLREIGDHVGVSTTMAHRLAIALEDQGHVRRIPGKARSIELIEVDLRGASTEALRAELERRGMALGALERPERIVFSRGRRACAADGCHVEVRYGHAFCLSHWRRITPAAREELVQANERARETRSAEDADRYQEAFTRARDEATTRRVG